MRTLFRILSSLVVAATLAGAAHAQNVRILGRYEPVSNGGFAIQWPGSGFEVQFRGTRLEARISDWGSNWLNVEVDGKVTPLSLKEGAWSYTLFEGAAGLHTVKVTRRTGTPAGITRFFQISSDGVMLPTDDPTRRLLVIGDAITSGYGVEGENQFCQYTHATQNHDAAYPALAAKSFGADIQSISADGRGLIRNFAGEAATMQTAAWQTLPDSSEPWPAVSYRPQVIVVNLGVADFAEGDPGDEFDSAYVDLLRNLRLAYPEASIFAAVGGMLEPNAYAAARNSIKSSVETLRSENDTKVHFLEFSIQSGPGRYGCDWHPGLEAHKQMADTLQAAIARHVGWKTLKRPEPKS